MQCVHPFRIKNPNPLKYKDSPQWLEVPCGHCVACRIARSREWAVRLLHESESWDDCVFLTFTYADEYLPPDGSLVPSELQKFWKRLRKDLGYRKIKYFCCGEYGDLFGRPHYHAIVFGLSVLDRKIIDENWPFGFVYYGTVTYKSCRYVAGYVQKKLYGKASEEYDVMGILPPYSSCSKGIGELYVEKHWNQLYQQGTVTVNGVKMGLPRYYMKKLDYDGYLNYNVDKDISLTEDFLKRYSSEISFVDSALSNGEISKRTARAEVEAMFDHYKIESNIARENNLLGKEEMFKRRKKS